MDREVKINNEEEEVVEENLDEVVIPPVDEETDTIVDEKKEEEPQEEISEPSPELTIKDVEGETPKERAMRFELTKARAELREEKKKTIDKNIVYEKKNNQPNERLEKLKEEYGDDELSKMEQMFEVFADKKGYVKKENTYKEMVDNTLNDFIDNNPEYKPENDKDDIRWGRFNEILVNDYNLAGKSHKALSIIFSKVNRDVIDEFGEIKADIKKQNAKVQKIESVSHSGGTKTKSVEPKDIDPDVRKMFKGFADEDFS